MIESLSIRPLILSVWKSARISVEGARWIIEGMSAASVVMDVPRCSLWLCTHDTRSTRQDDSRSKAKLGSMAVCTCPLLGSEVVEDTSSMEDTRENTLENAHPGSGLLEGTRDRNEGE